ncbi:hypothetical protein CK203_065230 [Vitis vinifera]|uniref:Transposase-associated domain-containing protein n=1 Tax=Vitis vinifera TaxID=29760 RepID=A0A438G2C1_VITVI|nr:hypothetical protein CK203_065230 [Vitis vinifera]
MDRDWMWLPNRLSRDYVEGVKSFIQVAKEHLRWDNKTRCPCRDCQNARFNDLLTIERHLIRFGFSRSYQKWIFHGEEHESQPNEQNDIGVDTEIVDATDADILNEVVDALNDACGHKDNDINLEESTTHGKFDYLLGEANKELYPGCKKFSALTFLVKLMHIKVLNRWSDKSFDMLLQVLVDAFPERSNIPKTYYDAKKMLRDLGLGYDSIHACKYDCALFWKENETLDKCPVCDEPRYKFCNGKGPQAPGRDIDVYLRPLIEELKELWHEGVQTFDVSTGENFRMHACVLWTINDFPAYGNLAGWSTKGYKACPVCNEDTSSLGIRSKICYMGHRRFLPLDHGWRRSRQHDGKPEFRPPPRMFSSDEILQQLCCLKHRKPGKTKDTNKARLDLADMNIRKELHLQIQGNKLVKPHACYTLTVEERKEFCKFLKSVKFPDGYAANLSRNVSINDGKISGLKSHDCHVLLQKLLPIAIRPYFNKDLCTTLVELCSFFQKLCAKTLNVNDLEKLEEGIVLILCKLERIFPPAFFDVMVHLMVHLPREAKLAGPVSYRWMYPFERNLGTLKRYVRNKARPEGSIAEAYIVNEALMFCSMYLTGIETRFNRSERNEDRFEDRVQGCLSIFSQQARPLGSRQHLQFSKEELTKAHWYIMNNCPELRPYLDEHTKELERTSSHNLEKRQEQEFPKWLADRMKALRVKQSPEATDELYSLACGPDNRVHTYMGCIVNGVRFHTKDRDDRRITQNSGICVSGEHDGEEIDFYGVLSNVVVLNYVLGYKVILFKCTWFDTNQKKKRIKHDYNFTTIQVTSTWYDNDPFILATQAQQVFYLDDYKNGHNWKVVQKVNHRHMWDVPERDTNIEIDEELCGGSDEEAYQDNESHELNWFVEQDDGFEFQRSDRLNIDPEVVNDNVLILENMNDNDDNFICDDIEEEDETLDDYANENEMWLSSDSESESD